MIFRKKHSEKEKAVFSFCYAECIFCIVEDERKRYKATIIVNWQRKSRTDPLFLSEKESITFSKNAVEEVFHLLKKDSVMDILEEVKHGEFRDMECHPPSPIIVQCDYEGLQYSFEDFYGCCYQKSCDIKTRQCLTSFMLELFKLYFLVKQKKL